MVDSSMSVAIVWLAYVVSFLLLRFISSIFFLMKVLFPRNIDKGLFSMNFSIGPLTISLIQMVICGIGVAAALWVVNVLMKQWYGTVVAIAAGLPIALLFIITAFFEISELSLVPFIMKKVRNNFFDTTKKYQVNYVHTDPLTLLLAKTQFREKKEAIHQKTMNDGKKVVQKREEQGLL